MCSTAGNGQRGRSDYQRFHAHATAGTETHPRSSYTSTDTPRGWGGGGRGQDMDTPTTQDTHTATARTCITQRTAAPAGGEGQQHARGRARDPASHALHYSRAWTEKQRPRAHDTASHLPTSHRSARHTSMRARASHVSRASVMPHKSESPEYHTSGSV